MAYAEKRGNLWRARWLSPDGKLESKPGFRTRKAAEIFGRLQEATIDHGTYADPRAGQITMTEWVNEWYPAQDLEPTTLANYRYAIEVHILPEFGHRSLRSVTPEEVARWERGIMARGFARRTARDARTTLTIIYGDHPAARTGQPRSAQAGQRPKGTAPY